MVPIWLCIFFSYLFYKSSCELITSLPGQPPNIFFKQHSGYIVTNSQHGRSLFYYFVHKMQHHFPLLYGSMEQQLLNSTIMGSSESTANSNQTVAWSDNDSDSDSDVELHWGNEHEDEIPQRSTLVLGFLLSILVAVLIVL
ncbi:hypothetical protein MTR67_001116 [Solanum verrucosum]|uniref:Uncharacterized protein n=1 Tax=Solanum verrucosum TaxID=315347 RepID=A0AAF0T775_SOLVR|nr:hypothetical protein MTR67_001116 [Solanum verrucosum]